MPRGNAKRWFILSEALLTRIKQEFEDRDEQAVALFESAAVGLSARGLWTIAMLTTAQT
jgi:hypothetical protein